VNCLLDCGESGILVGVGKEVNVIVKQASSLVDREIRRHQEKL